jgi:hypothetical protein
MGSLRDPGDAVWRFHVFNFGLRDVELILARAISG